LSPNKLHECKGNLSACTPLGLWGNGSVTPLILTFKTVPMIVISLTTQQGLLPRKHPPSPHPAPNEQKNWITQKSGCILWGKEKARVTFGKRTTHPRMSRQQPKSCTNVTRNLAFSNNIGYLQNNISVLNHELHLTLFVTYSLQLDTLQPVLK